MGSLLSRMANSGGGGGGNSAKFTTPTEANPRSNEIVTKDVQAASYSNNDESSNKRKMLDNFVKMRNEVQRMKSQQKDEMKKDILSSLAGGMNNG